MAIVKVVQNWAGQTCHKNTDKLTREYTQKWTVVVSAASDDINSVILASGSLPVLNVSTFASDSGSLCYDVEAHQVKPTEWVLNYKYSSNPPLPSQSVADPTARPAIFKSQFQQYDKPMGVDLAGIPVLNSAGQPFAQPPTAQRGRLILTVEKNYSISDTNADVATWLQGIQIYIDSCNVGDWFGYPAYSCRLVGVDAQPKEENQVSYLAVTYRIEVSDYDASDPELWTMTNILDCGYQQLVGGQLIAIQDTFGRPVTQPWPLDGSGAALAPGFAPSSVVYDTFNFYDFQDWSAIP